MLSKKEVQHIAQLARLKLNQAEIEKYQKQLSEILDFVEQLEKIETTKVEPCRGGTNLVNVVREDISQGINLEEREKLLNQAPLKEGNLIKTKGVFES
ncbi:MAG: Asp-tRNA(Asn)/Glu-tRNA(Gln) amidotransferase subunit GatC [Patescibacteria group bacterium]